MVTQILGLLALSAVLFLATGLQITGEAEDGGPKGPITGPITMIVAFLVIIPAWMSLAGLLTDSEIAQFVVAVLGGTVWVVFVGVGGLIIGEQLRTVIGLDPSHDPELTEVPWDE